MKLATTSTASVTPTTTGTALPTLAKEATEGDYDATTTRFWCIGLAVVVGALALLVVTRCWQTRHDDPPLYSFRWIREWKARRTIRRLARNKLPPAPPPSRVDLDVNLEEGTGGVADDAAAVVEVANDQLDKDVLPSNEVVEIVEGAENIDNAGEGSSSRAAVRAPQLPYNPGDGNYINISLGSGSWAEEVTSALDRQT